MSVSRVPGLLSSLVHLTRSLGLQVAVPKGLWNQITSEIKKFEKEKNTSLGAWILAKKDQETSAEKNEKVPKEKEEETRKENEKEASEEKIDEKKEEETTFTFGGQKLDIKLRMNPDPKFLKKLEKKLREEDKKREKEKENKNREQDSQRGNSFGGNFGGDDSKEKYFLFGGAAVLVLYWCFLD